jgi:drug/metabolite transporter (DMT)-like permease
MNFLNYDLLKKYKVYFVTAFLSIYPLVTALLSYYFFKEKISKYAFVGILFVVLGIMIINFSEYHFSFK